jgi:hypothetical protein
MSYESFYPALPLLNWNLSFRLRGLYADVELTGNVNDELRDVIRNHRCDLLELLSHDHDSQAGIRILSPVGVALTNQASKLKYRGLRRLRRAKCSKSCGLTNQPLYEPCKPINCS